MDNEIIYIFAAEKFHLKSYNMKRVSLAIIFACCTLALAAQYSVQL